MNSIDASILHLKVSVIWYLNQECQSMMSEQFHNGLPEEERSLGSDLMQAKVSFCRMMISACILERSRAEFTRSYHIMGIMSTVQSLIHRCCISLRLSIGVL